MAARSRPERSRRAATLYRTVAARAQHRCEYCRAPEAVFNAAFEIEHTIPRALGGVTTLDNLALACRSRNAHKADAIVATDPLTEDDVPLFNPRRHRWDDHFRLDLATGEIVGRGPIGRATTARLAMNVHRAVRARLFWLTLGLG